MELFEMHENRARPKAPESASMGPSKTSHDRSIAIRKCEAASNANEGDASNVASGERPRDGPEGMVDLRIRHQWDADDLMLYSWGNSPAAMERHHKKHEEKPSILSSGDED
ncbi:hypothetical protein BS47DRAFT_1066951 [Hydnum rufescens UP504]|uniref:Uncharacterized protein n=1 Tax=Hydnum rufescens UP504 TaxID=1448309 RepID=A0A9P6AVX8_9AGAM|nr:hypothetical protein BS47DRAFT_1066951 [Hydnum rufescens UP504]